jgi:hypothetical protein
MSAGALPVVSGTDEAVVSSAGCGCGEIFTSTSRLRRLLDTLAESSGV